LREAKGELVVFLQDWIHIDDTALQDIWDSHEAGYGYTFPVGKVYNKDGTGEVKWDWRNAVRSEGPRVPWMHWEIDYGAASRQAIIDAGLFDEAFDSGFGWENNDLARRMAKLGTIFEVNRNIKARAWDHDQFVDHPYKKKPNNKLFDSKNL